ncbi:hypothetical protein [Candidatus Thiosymbion oneisti]|uniref:hypothetical protein n=1 Tax=Candidatus Thiosymbion oneisti TaxID=589554 RepID=UPI0010619C70|nr:hypothetical protein [Candidatus Thiosymbion oneisti]
MPLDIRNQKIKGLADLRTSVRRADHRAESYKVYLRIAILEMEKAHRNVEQRHISRRGQLLDKRFREIDTEKRQLFEAMSMRDTTLKELRPAHQERTTAQQAARRAAVEAKRKADGPQQRQIANAEEQRRRETKAAREHGPRQLRQGFRLQY